MFSCVASKSQVTIIVKWKVFLDSKSNPVHTASTMMKSRNDWPPAGWIYVQPQTGWQSQGQQSFTGLVNSLIAHRLANPGLVKKHNWATDFESVANEVDAYNDARCRAHGWLNYVTGDQTVPFPVAPRPFSPRRGVVVGTTLKHVSAGVKTLLDWLGSGGRPVEQALAEKRATVCMTCPQNGTGGLEHYFTVPASQAIKLQLEIKNDLKLATSHDAILNVCEACSCPLKLKVWCPLDHILKEMDEATKAKLDPRCWILSEEGGASALAQKQPGPPSGHLSVKEPLPEPKSEEQKKEIVLV